MIFIGAAVRETTGFYILTGTDEVQVKVRTTVEQTQPWIEIVDRGTTKFALPATGLVPLAYGGTGAATAKGARTAIGLPEGSTNAAMPLIATTTAAGARAALGLSEYLTNAASALAGVIGVQAFSATTAEDGTVTNTFDPVFSTAPIVIAAQVGDAVTVTNNFTVTESNIVYTAGAPDILVKGAAIGAP